MTERVAGRRGRPPSEAIDRAVLAAARAIEQEVGYERTSIEAIAQRAGVARTTIYRRWPNKGSLMYEAVLGGDDRVAEIPDTGDLEADLLAVLTENAAPFRERRWRTLIGSLMADALADEALAATLRDRFFGPRADAIAERVRRSVERGELPPSIDADVVPALLTGPLQYLWIVRGSALDEDDLRRVVRTVLGR